MTRDPSAQALPPGLGEACSAIAHAVADSLDLGQVVRLVADAARLIIPFDAVGIWHAEEPDDPSAS